MFFKGNIFMAKVKLALISMEHWNSNYLDPRSYQKKVLYLQPLERNLSANY